MYDYIREFSKKYFLMISMIPDFDNTGMLFGFYRDGFYISEVSENNLGNPDYRKPPLNSYSIPVPQDVFNSTVEEPYAFTRDNPHNLHVSEKLFSYSVETTGIEHLECDDKDRPVMLHIRQEEYSVNKTIIIEYDDAEKYRLVRVTDHRIDSNQKPYQDTHDVLFKFDEQNRIRELIYNEDGEDISIEYIQYLDNGDLLIKHVDLFDDKVSGGKIIYDSGEARYTNDSRFENYEWDIPKAKTIFDKTEKSWQSTATAEDDDEDIEGYKLYNPDKPMDYKDLVEHFEDYRLDPEYAVLEKDDYPPFEPGYAPISHPDYAHPSRPFWMSPTEVTQAEFRDLMGYNPSYFAACGDTCPVENVTWFQALDYANRRSKAEGFETCYVLANCTERNASCNNVEFRGLDCKGYRLPTDEEWRYMSKKNDNYGERCEYRRPSEDNEAAIAEVNGTNWNALEDIAWTKDNSEIYYEGCRRVSKAVESEPLVYLDTQSCVGPHPVGTKAPDANGLYDFYGNVYEWVWDWFGYARRSGDSLGPDRGLCRIMRGGSVFTDTDENAVYRPGCYLPDMGGSVLGFRLVRTL